MRQFIKKKPMRSMPPWYRGFTGTIKPSGEKGCSNAVCRYTFAKSTVTWWSFVRGKYDCRGSYTKSSSTILQITELPLRKWTQDYKEHLGLPVAHRDRNSALLPNVCSTKVSAKQHAGRRSEEGQAEHL